VTNSNGLSAPAAATAEIDRVPGLTLVEEEDGAAAEPLEIEVGQQVGTKAEVAEVESDRSLLLSFWYLKFALMFSCLKAFNSCSTRIFPSLLHSLCHVDFINDEDDSSLMLFAAAGTMCCSVRF